MSVLPLALAALKLWEAFFVWANTSKLLSAGRDQANLDAIRKQAEDTDAIFNALGDLKRRVGSGKLPDDLFRD